MRTPLPLVCALAVTLTLAACGASGGELGASGDEFGAYPDPDTTVCVPTGEQFGEDTYGPDYACADVTIDDGVPVTVVYTHVDMMNGRVEADHWLNTSTFRALTDDELDAFHLTHGDDSIHPPKGPGCLFGMAVLHCVSPDHPQGFTYSPDPLQSTEDGPYVLWRGPTMAPVDGLPESLELGDVADYFKDYDIWILADRLRTAPINPFPA